MLDKKNRRYITENENIELTKTEFIVLNKLIKSNGDVVTRDKLLEELKGENALLYSDIYINSIIHRLRNKLKEYVQIKTKDKLGYYIPKQKED